jgi:hypothetical protein
MLIQDSGRHRKSAVRLSAVLILRKMIWEDMLQDSMDNQLFILQKDARRSAVYSSGRC